MLFTVFCRISNILKNHAFWQTIRIWFEDNFTFMGPWLEEAILIDWAQERGVIKYKGCVYKVNKRILNSKIEHWRPRPVFIVGR